MRRLPPSVMAGSPLQTLVAVFTVGLCALCPPTGFCDTLPASNLVPNGGFEKPVAQDRIADWWFRPKPGGTEVSLDGMHAWSGRQSLKLTGYKGTILSRNILLSGEETHPIFFQGLVRFSQPSAQHAEMLVGQAFADGTHNLARLPAPKPVPGRKGWYRVATVLYPAKPLERIRLRWGVRGGGDIWLDDIRAVRLTPEVLRAFDFPTETVNAPVRQMATFDDHELPRFLKPHVGSWQVHDGALHTEGQPSASGWYLRCRRKYHLDRLSFRLRKSDADGIFYLYTTDWRILIAKNRLSVKQQHGWTLFWNGALREVEFPAESWHRFELVFEEEALRVVWDGEDLLSLTSPAREWAGKIAASGKYPGGNPYKLPSSFRTRALQGTDQHLVFQAFNTGLALDDVSIEGRDAGAATDFHPPDAPRIRRFFRPEWQLDRLAPLEPVDMDWQRPPDVMKIGSALPVVDEWEIKEKTELGSRIARDRSDKSAPVLYRIGAENETAFPAVLQNLRGWPQAVRIFFNLASAGTYTLKLSLPRLGWGPNVLQVSVDGKPVSREVYRGGCNNWGNTVRYDYVPLDLPAGPHSVELRFSGALIQAVSAHVKRMGIGLGQVALVPGEHHATYERTVGRQPNRYHRPMAYSDPPTVGDITGKELRFRISSLPQDDALALVLGFYEVDVRQPGERLLDIYVNGRLVAEDLDAVKAFGVADYTERTFEAFAPDGILRIRLVGTKHHAFLNWLEVRNKDDANVLYRENCGWHPFISDDARPHVYEPAVSEPLPEGPLARAPAAYDGHNLIPNPHLALGDEKRDAPRWWYAAREFPSDRRRGVAPLLRQQNVLQGKGTHTWDGQIGHEDKGSLRIGRTAAEFGVIAAIPIVRNYEHRQEFTFFARGADAAGTLRPEIYWLAYEDSDTCTRRGGAKTVRILDHISGREKSGSFGWTRLSLSAVPPRGTVFAVLAVRVDENRAGSFWIDDADFDGQGADPLRITFSRLGFRPRSQKVFLISCRKKGAVHWTLLTGNGDVHRSGKARFRGRREAARRYDYGVDLSGLAKEGRYVLKARQGTESAKPAAFRIDRTVYRRLGGGILDALRRKRMNADVPDTHEPEALEDSFSIPTLKHPRFNVVERILLPGRRDTIGGYYDAGDAMKHVEFWPGVLLATRQARTFLLPTPPNTATSAQSELLWLAHAFHKFQNSDGTFYSASKPNVVTMTDNVPFYRTDRVILGARHFAQAAGAAALTAWELREDYPELSRTYIGVAEKSYRLHRDLRRRYVEEPSERSVTLNASKELFAEMFLYPLTGRKVYHERGQRHLRVLADGVREGLYRGAVEMSQSNWKHGGINQDFIFVLTEYLRQNSDTPLRPQVERALRAFAEDVRELAAGTTWGQARVASPEPGRAPGRYPRHPRRVGYWLGLAHSLGLVANALQDIRIARLAEAQLQWCLGKNMADLSVVHGVGDAWVAGGDWFFKQAEFYDTWLAGDKEMMTYDGFVPTLSFRDIGDGTVGGRSYGPAGYCLMYRQADYPPPAAPTEFYLPCAADALLATAGVEAAFDALAE